MYEMMDIAQITKASVISRTAVADRSKQEKRFDDLLTDGPLNAVVKQVGKKISILYEAKSVLADSLTNYSPNCDPQVDGAGSLIINSIALGADRYSRQNANTKLEPNTTCPFSTPSARPSTKAG